VKLCTFVPPGDMKGASKLGVLEEDEVVGVSSAAGMLAFLESGLSLKSLKKGRAYPLARSKLLAPVPRPGKILATIVNTQAMLGGDDVKLDRPRLDMKAPSTVIGPGETVWAPASGVRPEVELAAVIGRRIAGASPAQAKKAIFGYTILNDVTAPGDSREDAYEAYRRDPGTGLVSKRTMRGPLFRSKNHDTFCPMGPWVVSADELSATSELRMSTWFRGTTIQEGSTRDYLFPPEEIASYVSGFLTLDPGDVVSCGSIGWTGLGNDGDPSEFVLPPQEGTIEVAISGIGTLGNPVKKLARRQSG